MTEIRASDADRERVARFLNRHFAEGRLTADELSERLDSALAGRTLPELERLTRDLPGRALGRRERRAQRDAALRPRLRTAAVITWAVIQATAFFVMAVLMAACAVTLFVVGAVMRGGCAHRSRRRHAYRVRSGPYGSPRLL